MVFSVFVTETKLLGEKILEFKQAWDTSFGLETRDGVQTQPKYIKFGICACERE
jgi:hypothetical protein